MLAPLPPDYWSAEAAAHLALRAGFGQMPDESKKWSEQGMEAMLNHLLQTPADYVTPPTGQSLVFIYRQLGQTPFYPPNVKGWDGGKSWINTATLTCRYELARELVYGVLPEQVGLPKAPSATPTPSPTPVVNKSLAMETSMEEMAISAMNGDPGSMRVSTEQNVGAPTKNTANPGTSAHSNSPAPQKKPEPQVIPPAAPTPPTRLTTGFAAGRFVSAEDRKDPRRVVEKLSLAIFQATPEAALLDKFGKIAALNPVPLDDHAIRELATLMMTTPTYQLC